jgi:hypothetical protein
MLVVTLFNDFVAFLGLCYVECLDDWVSDESEKLWSKANVAVACLMCCRPVLAEGKHTGRTPFWSGEPGSGLSETRQELRSLQRDVGVA